MSNERGEGQRSESDRVRYTQRTSPIRASSAFSSIQPSNGEISKMLKLAACLLLIVAAPCHASPCTEMVGLPPLESISIGQKPIRFVVEALLDDAETIYAEGAHIVARKPGTVSETVALSKMETLHVTGESFHILYGDAIPIPLFFRNYTACLTGTPYPLRGQDTNCIISHRSSPVPTTKDSVSCRREVTIGDCVSCPGIPLVFPCIPLRLPRDVAPLRGRHTNCIIYRLSRRYGEAATPCLTRISQTT